MTSLLVGTSGYAYKEWKGTFYPANLPQKEFLSFYGTQFRAVEINNTFYRLPNTSVLEGWAAQVPDDFAFVLKASQRITHFKRLRDVEDVLDYYLRTARTLGDKLGPTLFQLPPNFKVDVGRLRAFLAQLPASWMAAFEFRHPSWQDDTVYEALRERSAVLVAAESDGDDAPRVATGPWGYLRLRKAAYTDAELDDWIGYARDQAWDRLFVFFKHEDEGTGPALARRFVARWGHA